MVRRARHRRGRRRQGTRCHRRRRSPRSSPRPGSTSGLGGTTGFSPRARQRTTTLSHHPVRAAARMLQAAHRRNDGSARRRHFVRIARSQRHGWRCLSPSMGRKRRAVRSRLRHPREPADRRYQRRRCSRCQRLRSSRRHRIETARSSKGRFSAAPASAGPSAASTLLPKCSTRL